MSGMRRSIGLLYLLLCMAPAGAGASQQSSHAAEGREAELVLRGQLDGRDHQTYRTVPFTVAPDTARITVEFDYTGREDRTTIDLGLLDPDGLRGWSGGNKRLFTVSASDATPSYLPGRLKPGTWHLLLGIPNIRPHGKAEYTARIRFTPADAPEAVPASLLPVLNPQPGWYRGDLHMHTAHSDASCTSQSGTRVPCPLFLTAQAASERGLDFVAITDHNTVSHLHDIRGLQPYYDRLLMIPGMEITTFQGHVNAFGLQADLDFRLGTDEVPDWHALLQQMQRRGVPVSINHPMVPSGERCMGCGWTPRAPVSLQGFSAVEAVNGVDPGTPISGIPFWHRQLSAGYRLTAIGGSDNHNAPLLDASFGASRIGIPTTVVHAENLSQAAILAGIRSGRVFIDVQGSRDRRLDFNARYDGREIPMGGALTLSKDARASFTIDVAHAAGGRVEVLVDGAPAVLLSDAQVRQASQRYRFDWRSDGERHWLSVNVYGADGRLQLLGNPIYVNYGVAAD
jgi:hypothetical protein